MGNGAGHLGYQSISGGGGGAVTITPVNQTPGTLDISGTASLGTPANWRSVTFVVNEGTIDINGVTYQEGTYTFNNDTFGTLASFQFDATSSSDASILFTT